MSMVQTTSGSLALACKKKKWVVMMVMMMVVFGTFTVKCLRCGIRDTVSKEVSSLLQRARTYLTAAMLGLGSEPTLPTGP